MNYLHDIRSMVLADTATVPRDAPAGVAAYSDLATIASADNKFTDRR